eukprot:4075337-Pleurochrysis_carterae.AAC.1
MARMSVARPIRNDFPPKSAASSPSVAAMSLASARDSVDVHVSPPSDTKSGVVLGFPNVRSCTGTVDTLSAHIAHSASNGHI